jgi:mRNA interferase MazF
VVIIPFTTNLRWARSPFCVAVSAGDGGLASDSVALCHQIRACDKARLLKRLGQLADATMVRIEQAVQVTLGM